MQNNKFDNSSDKDDFDVGLGFEKFATNVQGNGDRGANEDIDDFDFGNLPNKKEEEKQEEQFNFDIDGGNQKQNQNKSQPA